MSLLHARVLDATRAMLFRFNVNTSSPRRVTLSLFVRLTVLSMFRTARCLLSLLFDFVVTVIGFVYCYWQRKRLGAARRMSVCLMFF